MVTRLARLTLLLEALAYAVAGYALRSQGWSIAAIAAAIVATSVGVRLGFLAATLALSAMHASARTREQQLDGRGTLRLVAAEARAVLATNYWTLPFEQLAAPPEREPRPTERIPVILVHGYFSNRAFFGQMLRWLEEQGVAPVFAPNFPGAFATIESFAQRLHEEIERIAAGTGQPRVVLVCHSMGGLAARRYIAEHGAARVAKLITVASPHAGSALARWGLGANSAQMRFESDFPRELCVDEESRVRGLTVTSIYATHDNLVAPQATSVLAWARNVPLSGVGHITILRSPRMYDVLLAELREAGVELRPAREGRAPRPRGWPRRADR
jgi:triacylglycerol esterase/lipase EstA (alpha/beta hydrolase family)